jgi:hypothetical protein
MVKITCKSFPDKTRIFLFAFWIWTWILFKLTLMANFFLGLVIIHLPNYLMPTIKSKTPVKIIRAIDNNGDEITDKLNLFMNFKWDKNMFDDNGGIDLDIFFNYIGSSAVWIAYIFDYEIDNEMCEKFVNFIDLTNLDTTERKPIDYFKKCIRIAVINTGEKIMYKLRQNNDNIQQEDVIFGEIDFY